MSLSRRAWLLGVALSMAGLAPAQAAEDEAAAKPPASQCPYGEGRQLGGHTFQTPTLADFALPIGYLGLRAGGDVERVPDLPFGILGKLTLHSAQLAESVDLSVRVHDRVAIFGSLAGLGSTGLSVRDIAIRGTNVSWGGGVGALVKLLELQGTVLSVRGALGGSSGVLANLLALIDALASAPRSTLEELLAGNLGELLLTPFSRFNYGASVALAQALGSSFSLQASLGVNGDSLSLDLFDLGPSARRQTHITTIAVPLALALTADLKPSIRVPIAVMLEYQINPRHISNDNTGEANWRSRNTAALGLYFSGRRDVQAGVSAFALVDSDPIQGRAVGGGSAPSGTPQSYGGQIILRTFW